MRKFHRDLTIISIFSLSTCALLFFQRLINHLDPESLYLDDVWIAAIVSLTEFGEVFSFPSPAPSGFLWIQKIFYEVFSDPEMSLILFPLICFLISIPCLGILCYFWTSHLYMSLTAVLLIASSPVLMNYAIRAKQYTLDSWFTIIFLALVTWYFRARSAKILSLVLFLFGLVLPFSNTIIFLAFAFIAVVAVDSMLESKSFLPRKTVFIPIAGFFVFFSLFYFLHLSPKANEQMFEYWSLHYINFRTLRGTDFFFSNQIVKFFTMPFTVFAGWLGMFVPIGIYKLGKFDKCLKYLSIVFFLLIFVASAMRKFPIATGRVDCFTFPVILVFSSIGLWTVVEMISKRFVLTFPILFLVSIVCVFGMFENYVLYPQNREKGHVKMAASFHEKGSFVIMNQYCSYAAAYYGPWDSFLRRDQYSTNGFSGEPRNETVRVYSPASQLESKIPPEDLIVSRLRTFLTQKPDTFVYLGCMQEQITYDRISEFILSSGYSQLERSQYKRSLLVRYELKTLENAAGNTSQ